jgi:hypothetical protein
LTTISSSVPVQGYWMARGLLAFSGMRHVITCRPAGRNRADKDQRGGFENAAQ